MPPSKKREEDVVVLEYAIEATKQIMSLMIVLGMAFAYVACAYTTTGKKVFRWIVIAGVAAATWMAVMKNATNKINTSAWNLRIYWVSLAAFLVFVVFVVVESLRAKKSKASIKVPVSLIALGAYVFLYLFLVAPDFIAYPYSLMVSETTVFSSSYVLKFSGVVIGFVLTLVAAIASNRMGRRLGRGPALAALVAMLIVNQVKQLGAMTASMITNRIIASNHTLFSFAVFILNHDDLFTYLTMAVACVAAVVMLVRGAHVNEPYSNPAQHRKIRAKWRNNRRWAVTSLVCAGVAVLLMTWVNSIVNAEVQLSPTEDATIVDGNAVVTFDEVSDGHLHRYGYTTENGTTVRFIVIQKPNSNLYGVGMDCCDICGETGYYENSAGDIVCNRCDVIMNINTIGFKGGCNPKVVDYTVENGQIIIPVEQLTQYEKDFSK